MADLGEDIAHALGLDKFEERMTRRLDRIERRLEALNITPADLETLEEVKASLRDTDTVLDAIEPEGT